MFGRIVKTLLIASAVAPVGLVYAWLAFRDGSWVWALSLIATCFCLVTVSLAIFSQSKHILERFPLKMVTIEAADRENVAFLVLYLFPLFFHNSARAGIETLIPTLFIFLLITATGYSYHFNPLIGIFGWHFYKISTAEGVTYVLLTKRHLRNTRQIDSVGQLTDYILIDFGDKNAD